MFSINIVDHAPRIHPLGEEIILSIHAFLKSCGYRHPKKSKLLGYVEDISNGMKMEGLIRLADQLNLP